jgi:uncharacterized protein (DUF362 family)
MKSNHGVSRRNFLFGAALSAGAITSSCSFSQFKFYTNALSTLRNPGPEPLPPTRAYPEMAAATVAIVGVKGSIENAVREAVAASGGMVDFEKGQKVMIKPNATTPSKSVTTNPEVIRAVIRLVKERGCHAMVGDRSAFSDLDAMKTCGYEQVCREEGAELYPWINSDYLRFFPKQRYWTDGFRFPKILTEVAHWISVPVLKNHQVTAAEFTCCLKAFVGVCHPQDRFQKGDNALHQKNISEKIAELNLCSRPALNIVDATNIMVHGGPGGLVKPIWARSDLILASRDRVACDSLALAALKFFGAEKNVELPYVQKSVWDQVQIYRAAELGIGQADPAHIEIEDAQVPNFDQIRGAWREESKK